MAEVYGLVRKSDPTVRYVGFTSRTTLERFKAHKVEANRGTKRPVYNWFRKYDDVTFIVLHEVETVEEAFELEKREIAARENLLNLTAGGEGTIGMKHSIETIKFLSERVSGSNNPTFGKQRSKETKDKLRLANLGKIMPEETKQKIAKSTRGVPKSASMRAKLSASKTGVPRPLVKCPHCEVSMAAGNVNRYHFDNCKTLTALTERI